MITRKANRDYYLAIDLGASSGRHILAYLEDGIIKTEEIYRFENGIVNYDGTKCWDIDGLFASVKEGIKCCARLGKIPVSIGIDTWGVDFVLLDRDECRIGNACSYRDERTTGMDEEVYKIISEADLYARGGIQKQIFNTIYQLMAIKKRNPDMLERASTLLMIPDYLNFMLTGKKCAEYTIATTSQLIDPKTKNWDMELIKMLGYPENIFPQIKPAGSLLGRLSPEIAAEVGFDCDVVLPPSHDTASAILAVPSNEKTVYISSGTWSLMGVESEDAILTDRSHNANFSNEGGYGYKYRFLKNIMGLWMIQSVRREFDVKYSYAELCDMAQAASDFPSRVDVDDISFFSPSSMADAIRKYCEKTGQKIPVTPGEFATVIYQSLALRYSETVEQIESVTGMKYRSINVVGGGSSADYLNQLTANATGRTVYAGPSEATAIGNIIAQMLRANVFDSVAQARECIFDSFDVKTFNPQ